MARHGRKGGRQAPVRPAPVPRFALPAGKRWLVPVLLGIIVIVALGLRASDLRADPPPDLSWSYAPYTDEGLNTYSARNLVLYGTAKTDDFFPFVIYPLVNFLVALVFKLFGIGFVQVKLISLLAGLASIFVVFLLVRDEAGPLAGLFAALGLATCFPHVMYTRLGLVESVQILFLLLAGLYYARGLKRPWLMALSGLFAAGTVLLVKISALFVAPVILLMLVAGLVETRRDPARFALMKRGTGLFFAGVGAAILVWFFTVFLPYRADYVQYVLRHSFESPAGHPETLVAYLFNTFMVGAKSHLVPRLPFIAALGFLFLPGFGLARKPGLRYLLAWFVFGVLMLGYMNYRPPRYEIILLPPLVAIAGVALARLLEQGTLLPAAKRSFWKAAGYGIWLWPLVTQLLVYTNGFWGAAKPGSEAALIGTTFGISVALAVVAWLAGHAFRNGVTLRPIPVRAVLVGLLLLLVLRFDFAQFFNWYSSRTHDMVRYSREVDELLPEDAVLAGGWAPALLMESRKRALCVTDWANNDDPVGRFGATHLVSHEQNDVNLLEKSYPALRDFLQQVWTGRVRNSHLTVYRFVRPGE